MGEQRAEGHTAASLAHCGTVGWLKGTSRRPSDVSRWSGVAELLCLRSSDVGGCAGANAVVGQ